MGEARKHVLLVRYAMSQLKELGSSVFRFAPRPHSHLSAKNPPPLITPEAMVTIHSMGEFFTVAIVHLLAVMSPGPDFAVVVQQSVLGGRRAGVVTALGIASGLLVHITYCLLGLAVLFAHSVVAFSIAKYLGALYLLWLGIKGLRARATTDTPAAEGADVKIDSTRPLTNVALFWRGFLTNALNPKATLFFLALFTVVISPVTSSMNKLGYGLWMVFATALWFAFVAHCFSYGPLRALIMRQGHWFDRIMGAALVGLAVKVGLSKGAAAAT